jgi:hypothetical protein
MLIAEALPAEVLLIALSSEPAHDIGHIYIYIYIYIYILYICPIAIYVSYICVPYTEPAHDIGHTRTHILTHTHIHGGQEL